MRPPLWIINIALFFLALFALIFIFFSRMRVPAREDIEPVLAASAIKTEVSKINLSKIYENDLFDTYQKRFPEPTEKSLTMPMPEPPVLRQPQIAPPPPPQFLEPLKITLKGIVTLSSDDGQNIAIIADNKTNKETNYKVGDTIEDAQLLRIFRHKIILVRSNGQQEVLYLRQQDAKQDPAFAMGKEWDDVVKKIGDDSYLINPTEFVHYVPTLSTAMDLLDLTTVYHKGKSVGVRIGKLTENSLGAVLGFAIGDIVTKVNDISTAESANKLKIYQLITSVKTGDTLNISVLRGKKDVMLKMRIQDFESPSEQEAGEPESVREAGESYQERIRMLQEKEKFAPTVREIKLQERRNMMDKGAKPLVIEQDVTDQEVEDES